jgi:polysaccharide export outer membrane protein
MSLVLAVTAFAADTGADAPSILKEERSKESYLLGQIYKEHGMTDYATKEFQSAYDVIQNPSIDERLAERPAYAPGFAGRRGEHYVIGKGDVLSIAVWENPDLTKSVKVRPDGMLTFPLIGDFEAVGKTLPEIDEVITERLKEFVRYPDVTVTLDAIGPRRVIVLGEVGSPGVTSLGDTGTMLEVLTNAGSPSKTAVLRSVMVIRDAYGPNPKPERVNFARYMKHPNPKDNVILTPRDVVYVPEIFLSDLSRTMSLILDPLNKGIVADKVYQYYENRFNK